MKFWLLAGSLENWDRAISDNVWGVREGLKRFWDQISIGDILIFYATSPVSGVIGIGKVESKLKQDKPLWPDEVRENKVIYPYRFGFIAEYVVSKPYWQNNKINIRDLRIQYRSGLNSISDKDALKTLFGRMDSVWNTKLISLVSVKEEKKIEKPLNLHDEMKEKILEIGKIERFISETEYPMNSQRLDVVWRRVAASVPTYVFEVQIGGNVYQALAKLKHAYDIWNSNIFLIIRRESIGNVEELLGGVFHEIKYKLKIITTDKIYRLFEIQKEDVGLKSELGLI